MEASTTTRLSDIVAALDAHVRHVRKLGLKRSALLLEMAKLDLQMQIHEIRDVELDQLCKAIERQEDEARAAAPPKLRQSSAVGSTVVSLFGDRSSTIGRATADEPIDQTAARGARRVREKTVVPR